jgi:tetratricopeptide (TPR) repeat protein
MLREILIRRHSTLHAFLASYYLTIYLSARRDREAAERYMTILLDAAAELNDPYYLAISWDIASDAAFSQGSFALAYDRALRAQQEIARCPPTEAAVMARSVIEHNVGYSLLALGRHAEAIIPLQEGIAGLERSGCGAHSATGYVNLALALFTIGETEQSEAHLLSAEKGLTGNTQWLAPYVHYLRGEIAQRRGNHTDARTHYERLREYYPDFQNIADILAVVSLLPVLLPEPS